MDDRLTKLEILYSDQSRMLEELSKEVFHQQRDITRLRREISELKEKIETQEIGGNERPPHY